jgi:hypothetical protein
VILRVIGRLLLLTLFYLILTPIALIRRAVAGDPLRHPLGKRGYWAAARAARPDGGDMRRPS